MHRASVVRRPWFTGALIVLFLACSDITGPDPKLSPRHPPVPLRDLASGTTALARMIGAGDIASCASTHDSATALLVSSYLAKHPGTTVYTLGDNVYEDGTAAEYTNCYQPTWGAFKSSTRASIGNHEYNLGNATPTFDYFGSLVGPRDLGYYSYDVGAWHAVVLNSNTSFVDAYVGGAQETWLRNDLAANTKRCIVAYWHHPRFYSTDTDPPGLSNSMKNMWADLYQAGATLVLNGHQHMYERFAPQDPEGRATRRGIREFIVGVGGRSYTTQPQGIAPNSEVRQGRTYGVMELLLGDSTYSWNFIATPGYAFADSGSGKCVDKNVNYPPTAIPGGPYTGYSKKAVAFDGSTSFDPEGNTPLTYAWDFGDGSTGSGATPTHTYSDTGKFTVTLTVTDANGAASAPATTSISVANQPPVAKPGGPYFSVVGTQVFLDGSASSDPDGNLPLTYAWSFGDGTSGTGATPSHTYADTGRYTITLTVTDARGLAGTPVTTTATISTKPNQAPTASPGGPYSGTAGQAVSFDGSKSSDPDGDLPLTYAWNFGDASTGTGATPVHTYSDTGHYTVTLTVTDAKGLAGAPVTTQATIAPKPNQAPVANAGGPYTGTAGATVSFDGSTSSDPDGDLPLTYAWSFGDGGTGTGPTPAHTYSTAGTYTITLTVTDAKGLAGTPASATATITSPVNQAPVASAGGPYTGPAESPVAFDGSASSDPDGNLPLSYAWNFGDGASGTGTNPTHVYAAAGTFTVSLIVTDALGASSNASTTTATITAVNQPPVAKVGGPYSGTAGTAVTFDGSASTDPDGNTPLTYAWTFGDGTSGTGANPTHVYASAGSYTVSLVVTDAKGLAGAASSTTATIAAPPNQAPTANPGGPYGTKIGTALTLDGSSSTDPDGDLPLSYAWSFGDGSQGTGARPTHTYASPGTYTVTLTVTDARGASSAPVSTTATIAPHPPPVANAGGPYAGIEGSAVAFDGSASFDPDGLLPLTYAWNFGDGATGSGVRPTHAYADNGTYTVSLTVTDAQGLTSSSATAMASIANAAPVVNAGPDGTMTVGTRLAIQWSFSDAGVNDSRWSYQVDWGDGSVSNSTSSTQGAIGTHHTWTAAGAYTVKITVTDKDGASGSDIRVMASSGAMPAPPVASVGGPYTGTAGTAVTFDGSGSSDPGGYTPLTYAWTFGDGSSGQGVNPTHTYAGAGSYTVSLVVTDSKGVTSKASTTTATIAAANQPPVAQAGGPYTGTAGAAVSFDGSASSDPDGNLPLTYAWNFGDGSTGTGATLTHTYAAAGTYTVSLTVTDAKGLASTASTTTATVAPKPNQAPVASAGGPYTGTAGSAVGLDGSASSDPDGNLPLTYAWTFGDGASGTGVNPTHAYASAGTYTVSLTVTDALGLAGTPATTTATIAPKPNEAPVANVGGPYSGTAGTAVAFDGNGSSDPDGNLPLTYAWTFGDGTTGTGANPTHAYAAAGSYTVSLTVTDALGLSSSPATTTATIAPKPNEAPAASVGGPYSGTAGTAVAFDGSASADPDGDTPLSYAWNFGDGSTGTGATPTHVYTAAGTFTVTLTVTDAKGLAGAPATTQATIAPKPNEAPVANAGGPYSGTAGTALALDGNSSSDPDGDLPLTYAWNFGDGSTGTGATPTHTYASAGTYTATLTVTDAKGLASAPATTTATIAPKPNEAPVAKAGGPYSGTAGMAMTVDGSASSDPDGNLPLTYTWNFGDGSSGTGVTPTHTYAAAGTYTVTLTVTDALGLSSSAATTTATVAPKPNEAPVANAGGPYSGTAGTAVTFDGNASNDPDGDTPLAYAWTFGDGATGTGTTATHAYAAAGTFTVTLTVTDAKGLASAPVTTTATIAPKPNEAPVASAGGPYSGTAGTALTLDGSASSDPDGNTPLTYAWSFGDGSSGTEVKPTHTYAAAGAYTVTLTVTDALGLAGAPATATATIAAKPNEAPIANAGGPYSGTAGMEVSFNGSASSDPDGDLPLTYAWNFGDGTTGTGVNPTHAYASAATYTASLTVSDAKGLAGAPATATVTITPRPNEAPVASAGGPYTGTAGSAVVFDGNASTDPDGDLPLTYAWTFGDGSTGTGAAPSHTYVSAGTYSVALTVTDAKGLASAPTTTTATIAARPNEPPVAVVGGPYSGTAGTAVNFDGSASSDPDGNLPLTYNWNFGDGTSGTGEKPSHTYASAGTYTVGLIVTDALGLSSTASSTTATIVPKPNEAPVANAGGPYTGTAGTVITFDANGSSDPDGNLPLTYAWNFGDGTSGTGATPTHTYATAGTYTVSLTVTDAKGLASAPVSTTATVAPKPNEAPVANAGGPYSGTAGTPVSFDGNASSDPDGNTPLTYSWEFGDGTNGTGATPSHAYATAGTYTVSLTVTDALGARSSAATTSVTIAVPNQPPVAHAGGPYSGTAGTAVAFDGSASTDPDGNLPLTYSWNFGDGSTGTGATPTHAYASAGTYTATLTVTDAKGLAGTPGTTSATIAAANQPPVAHAGGPYTGTAGTAVTFDGSGSSDPDGNTPLTYAWEFGDGASGTGATPSHPYATAGTYTVTLTVTDNKGLASAPVTTTATVAPKPNQAPVANAGGPYTGTAATAVTFDGSGSSDPDGNLPLTYAWTFGDGTTGTGATPTHSYASAGTYTVTLTVTDALGASSSASTTTATIAPKPNEAPVAHAGGPYTGTAGAAVSFDGSASSDPDGNTPLTYAWNFGDAGTGTGEKPTHVYASAGTYTVTLTVTDALGLSSTPTTTTATIAAKPNEAPIANAGGPYTGTAGAAVSFDGSGSSDPDGNLPLTYAWSFGDGSTGSGEKLTHAYANSGTYTVTLTVTDALGLSSSASSTTATIAAKPNEAPVANAGGPYTGTAGTAVSFDGNASTDPDGDLPLTYAWNFGDGSSGTGATPTHTYASAGTYTVTLTVTDAKGLAGAPATTTATIAAKPNQAPVANAGGPYTGAAGTALTLDGSISSDPDGNTPLTYAWNLGDGNSATGVKPTHTYAAAGTYTVTLTVTDALGLAGAPATTTATIAAPNQPPTANAGGPYTGTAGTAVTVNGSASSDPDGDLPLTYAWTFGDGASASGANPTHVYASAGTYTVTLTVTDAKGLASAPATTSATIAAKPNEAPVANAGGAYTGTAGAAVTFDGSASSDPDGNLPLTYAWNFGDGSTGTAEKPTHVYAAAGTYSVTLTVTDALGLASSAATTTATVAPKPNEAPVATVGGPYTGTAGTALTFDGSASTDPDGNLPLTYAWTFGDGASGTGATPTHTYAAAGNYTVSLTVTDALGLAGTPASTTATVAAPNQPPVANAGGPYSGTAGTAVSFNGSGSTDPDGDLPLSYAWTFGDGSTASGATASHSYAAAGTFTVTLTVTDARGLAGTPATTIATVAAKPNEAPVANAGGPYTATAGTPVTLDGSASTDPDGNLPLTYAWDFGDGTSGTGEKPVHTYASAGTYTATLTVTDALGLPSSASSTTATVAPKPNEPPIASAGGPYSGTAGTSITLDGSASTDPDGNLPLTYSWSFGDGSTGADVKPTHTYASAGTYTVTLTVTDAKGLAGTAATTTATIAARPNEPPVANPGGPYSGTAGTAVNFDGSSSSDPDGNTPLTYAWNFGDGSSATGVKPTHTYASAGTYTIALTVTDALGLSSAASSTTATMAAKPNEPPVANAGGPYSGTVGTAITVDGSASSDPDGNLPLAYAWAFGDGTSGTGERPTHVYAAAGTYTVTLTVTDALGLTGGTSTTTATVAPKPNEAPVASVGGPYTGTAGTALTFDGSASSDPDGNLPLTYAWNFGDGSTGTGVNPAHMYAAAGTYTVSLTVTDALGLSGLASTTTATIAPKPNEAPVAVVGGPYAGTAGAAFAFDGTASSDPDGNTPLTYAWNFGDGSTGTGATPTHTYSAAGTYTVALTVTDALGLASNAATTTATVAPKPNEAPVANVGGPYSGTAGSAVAFDGNASSDPDGNTPLTYAWNFGDGGTGTGATPTHVYATAGSYTVSLVVTDALGLSSSPASATATIAAPPNEAPIARVGGPYTGTAGTAVAFDGSASSDPDGDLPLTYAWTFGDGSSGTGATPTHDYAAAGTYTVSLTVTDAKGLAGTPVTTTATIAPKPNQAPIANAGGPYSGTAGTGVSFDASASSDPDGNLPLTYAWQFGDGSTGAGATPTHVYASAATYTVTLTVTDALGASSSSTTTATIAPRPNQPPIANAGGPYNGEVSTAIAFNGSASSDPDGNLPLTYAWNFGDGTTGTGVTPSHTYASAGTYTVTLTVSDALGLAGTPATTSASVAPNQPPVAVVGGPYTGIEGTAVTFDGSASSDPDANLPLTYAWKFGDGSTGSGVRPTHAYVDNGTYTVTLTTTDALGASSTASSTTATIANAPPVVNAGANASATVGTKYSMKWSFSDPGTNDGRWSYTVNWGDGTSTNSTSLTQGAIASNHTWTAAGSYTVKVTVTDKDGGSGSGTRIMTVK